MPTIRAACTAALSLLLASSALAQTSPRPWLDPAQSPQVRARAAVAAMTTGEKLRLVFGFDSPTRADLAAVPDDVVSPDLKSYVLAHAVKGAAGFVPGVPRLGIPDQTQTDASMGVRDAEIPSTALPSSLATAASFDPEVTRAGGAMIGSEAKASGFNTFLAGGVNLDREPRNGRNFEYTGEDPLLAGVMAGGLIRGIQSAHMVSTMKHFAINDQESQRTTVDATLSAEAMRQSDLLAFEFALEQGRPASVMCSYNLVNGRWACENDYLLNKVLKQDWAFNGFVMSDWGAVHSTADAANNGLDQFTGFPCCNTSRAEFAPKALGAAIAAGQVPAARLDDMAERILWALFSTGAVDVPPRRAAIDYPADAMVAQRAAEQSLVLLKNEGGLLPLRTARSLAVIGGHADKGVLSGGGSSAVTPVGGDPLKGAGPKSWPGPMTWMPSSPLEALRRELPGARVGYAGGQDVAAAAALARRSDVAVVFVTQWLGEGFDGKLELDGGQDALVAAVAAANPHTIVVVESGGAVLMPWLDRVPAVLEAFYPGIRGGQAIARILTGKVDPSGHLPISFPASDAQLAHASIPGFGKPDGVPVHVSYDEGAAIGYKWYDLKGYTPLFAFGHGLGYTRFALSAPAARVQDGALKVSVAMRNTGAVAGAGVAQVYLAPQDWRAAGWEAPKRLGAFAKAALAPGEARNLQLTVDPRLLATWEAAGDRWTIRPGTYRLRIGQSSDQLPLCVQIDLPEASWSAADGAPADGSALPATASATGGACPAG
jgi:beta-glucosidase